MELRRLHERPKGWKNLKQRGFNSQMHVEHKAFTELDDINKLVKAQNIVKQLARDLMFRRF